MRWFAFIFLLCNFKVFSMEATYEERLSDRMRVIKVLCDSGQEPNLCPLWQRITEAKQTHDTALGEWSGVKERLKHIDLTGWDDYMGSLCEGLEDNPESVEDDPFVSFCDRRAQLIEAKENLNEAKSLLEIMRATAGVEGALDMEQAEHNMRITEENYDIIKGIVTDIICVKTDEFPEAIEFCLFLEEAHAIERNYQERRALLESMNDGRMDYKIRQLCKHNKYHLPCDKLQN